MPGTVSELPSGPETLIVSADFPRLPPDRLFQYWTDPGLLTMWWPPEAEIDPRVGGAYHLAWPTRDWHLRGIYTEYQSGERLAFTWKWDHDPADHPGYEVHVTFAPLDSGTRFTLTHGPYADSASGAEERRGHLEGWQYFLGRLGELA